jgi:hypothetical protein
MLCGLSGYTPSEADVQRQQEVGFDHYFVEPLKLSPPVRHKANDSWAILSDFSCFLASVGR